MVTLQNIIYSGQFATIAYTLLILSFIVRLWNKALIWGVCFLCYLTFAFIADKITLIGLLLATIFFLQVYFFNKSRTPTNRYLWCVGIFIWAVLAKLHMLPGFNNWHIIVNKKISFDAVPYNLYINFDTPIIGIVLYGFLFPKLHKISEFIKKLFKSKYIIISGIVTILAVSSLLGFVKIDLKYPEFFKIWLILNIITVITEEVFFRGWLLNLLLDKFSVWLSIIITSIVFGLLHFQGGHLYILLATIASIFYSYIYVKTKAIESSMFLHLLVNIIHILFFTYPALA